MDSKAEEISDTRSAIESTTSDESLTVAALALLRSWSVREVKSDAADSQQHPRPPGDTPGAHQHERRHEQHKPKHLAFVHESR